ncbi:hypothetical protein CYMTET_4431 [Cymbomonas tetramitiformis]|uniref:Uncharacterized protein n=1 Tax=Cymbomonas tetramitiformis TaxID=36881 RepID=A0AAE0LK40_9CHLO|nr:hypothetical protein CYMTET_4431 [Cymbomonas tetramitiformis]|eukprot:gene1151-1720_t
MYPAYPSHTLNRIQQAATTLSPYEHVVIYDIFHPEYYPCILKHLPLQGANYGGTISKGLRHYVRLKDAYGNTISPAFGKTQAKHLSTSPSKFTKFWREFGDTFGSDQMRDAWVRLFHATMKLRFTGKRGRTMLNATFGRLDLSRDGKDYFISPHTDTVMKVITTLFYLPVNGAHPELGTVVFKSKTSDADGGGGKTWNGKGDYLRDFDIIREGTFMPNTVFAFAPCTSSWHGVPLVTENLRRDTVQGFISMPTAQDKKKGKKKRDMVGGFIKANCTVS